ncbi:MAG TPA: hypothetical protein DD473_03550 [Planctomycetaceae bacterium]|nr:hypothetical protein [Planctomycetaceae bacterium]
MISQRLTYIGLESYGWAALLILCFLTAVCLVVWLYQYERKLVSAPVGWTLMSLRVLLLAVLLLMALQPTMSWTNSFKEQMSVLVALDVSQSMDLIDEHATDEERKQWAVGLGMIKKDVLEDSSITSEAEADSGEGQNIVGSNGAESPIAYNETTYHMSRFDLARQLLSAPKIGLLDRLKDISGVEVVLFSRSVKGTAGEDLAGSRETLSDGVTSATTSFTKLLDEIAARENCTAAVVISDGVDTSGEKPLSQLKQLSGQSRSIFSILAGSVSQPVDLAIESTDHPESVYKKDQPLIRVRATTHGYEGRNVTVTLTDVATGNRMTQEVLGGERFADVEFSPVLNTPGRQRFIVDVSPSAELNADQGSALEETQQDNNQQEFAINVIDDTTRILLVDGEARWEFRFLDAAFERDDRVNLNAVLFEQPYLGLLPHSFFDSSLPNAKTSAGPFDEMDMVIWGDADPKSVDQGTWEKLERFVGERGGTLVVSAGKRHFSGVMQNPILAKMMPIEHFRHIESNRNETAPSPNLRGFHLKLTPQGEQHPVMKLDSDNAQNLKVWANLPGHFHGLVGDPKPGAVVLATPVGGTISSTTTRPAGAIVVQNYGLGRVLWLGIDSTWRWRSRRGDKDHYRFWGQMSRWAAEMRSSAGSDDVRLAIDATEVEEGEQTTVRARWSRKLLQNTSGEIRAEIEVYPSDENQLVPIMRFPLVGLETEPMLHEAQIPELPVGEYRLRLTAADIPLGPVPIEAKYFVNPRQNSETNQLSADRSLLEQFAAATNGAVFLPHQMDELLARLNPDSLTLEEKTDFPLWNHWLMFVMIMGILTAEWLVRKWYGLP